MKKYEMCWQALDSSFLDLKDCPKKSDKDQCRNSGLFLDANVYSVFLFCVPDGLFGGKIVET